MLKPPRVPRKIKKAANKLFEGGLFTDNCLVITAIAAAVAVAIAAALMIFVASAHAVPAGLPSNTSIKSAFAAGLWQPHPSLGVVLHLNYPQHDAVHAISLAFPIIAQGFKPCGGITINDREITVAEPSWEYLLANIPIIINEPHSGECENEC